MQAEICSSKRIYTHTVIILLRFVRACVHTYTIRIEAYRVLVHTKILDIIIR